MVLPAFGVISETVTVHSQKPFLATWRRSSVLVLWALVWGHHLFVSGRSVLRFDLLFITFGVAVRQRSRRALGLRLV